MLSTKVFALLVFTIYIISCLLPLASTLRQQSRNSKRQVDVISKKLDRSVKENRRVHNGIRYENKEDTLKQQRAKNPRKKLLKQNSSKNPKSIKRRLRKKFHDQKKIGRIVKHNGNDRKYNSRAKQPNSQKIDTGRISINGRLKQRNGRKNGKSCKKKYIIEDNSFIVIYSKKSKSKGSCQYRISRDIKNLHQEFQLHCPTIDLSKASCSTERMSIKLNDELNEYCDSTQSPVEMTTHANPVKITHTYNNKVKNSKKLKKGKKTTCGNGFVCFIKLGKKLEDFKVADYQNCGSNFDLTAGESAMLYNQNTGIKSKCSHTFTTAEKSNFGLKCGFLKFVSKTNKCADDYLKLIYTNSLGEKKQIKYCAGRNTSSIQSIENTSQIKVIQKRKKSKYCHGGYACYLTNIGSTASIDAANAGGSGSEDNGNLNNNDEVAAGLLNCDGVFCDPVELTPGCYYDTSRVTCCPVVVCNNDCKDVICQGPPDPKCRPVYGIETECCPIDWDCTNSYLITTPKYLYQDTKVPFCVFSTNTSAGGTIKIDSRHSSDLLIEKTMDVTGGGHTCVDIEMPSDVNTGSKLLSITGLLGGVNITKEFTVKVQKKPGATFVQTDKYLYLPGQVVQIRVFSIEIAKVDYSNIEEMYIETPGKTRIAEWKDVPNKDGVVHLQLQLADEIVQGKYKVVVYTSHGKTSTFFKVESYVLPKFEVILNLPDKVGIEDTKIDFEVCSKYTFGKAVTGSVLAEVFATGYSFAGSIATLISSESKALSNGCASFSLNLEDKEQMRFSIAPTFNYKVNATVTEDGTEVKESVSQAFYRSWGSSVYVSAISNNFIKPNIPFIAKLNVASDLEPLKNENVEICIQRQDACKNFTTDDNGSVTVVVVSNKSDNYPSLSVSSQNLKYTGYVSFQLFNSPSNTFLEIAPFLDSISFCKDNSFIFDIITNYQQPTIKVAIQVFSNELLLLTKYEEKTTSTTIPDKFTTPSIGTISSETVLRHFTAVLDLPAIQINKLWVLVWFSLPDGEVVIGSTSITSDFCTLNQVSLELSSEAVKAPGDTTTVKLSAEPSSVCSLGVVDKAVNILKTEKEVDLKQMLENLMINNMYFESQSACRWGSNSEAIHLFDASNVYVFTDLTVETTVCDDVFFYFDYDEVAAAVAESDGQGSKEDEDDTIRSHFPETWLWDLYVVPDNGEATTQETLPDSITEWVGEVMCMHNSKGIGYQTNVGLTVFKPFFVSLTLPANPKRGEKIPITASVFNYLQSDLPIKVVLEPASTFTIEGSNEALVCVPKNEKTIHTFTAVPSEAGEQDITVTASVDNTGAVTSCAVNHETTVKSDGVKRTLRVKYEGIQSEETTSEMICDSGEVTWKVEPPTEAVDGSSKYFATLTGSIMGPTIQHLEKLVKQPYGCGEQNMINFVPNIYVRMYLESTGELTDFIKDKTTTFMTTGYQKELTYKLDDGSYSAFGNSDKEGSTWLSAFVYKSYVQAGRYINIDNATVSETRSWLLSQTKTDGCFESKGMVRHKAMKGGLASSSGGAGLTSYIVAVLIESNNTLSTSDKDILRKAVDCLIANSDSSNAYIASLKAYALVLYKHADAAAATQDAFNKVTTDTTLKTSILVEAIAYVLLALLNTSPLDSAKVLQAIKMMNSHRNADGGFDSTQDTVVALQAIATYEEKTRASQQGTDIQINVKYASIDENFHITNENNYIEHHTTVIKEGFTDVTLSSTGTGCFIAVGILRFNHLNGDASQALSLKTSFFAESQNTVFLGCAEYLQEDGESNMMVMEISLFTGYSADRNDLDNIVNTIPNIKKCETNDNEVNIYFSSLKTREETCVRFSVNRELIVFDPQPGTVLLYDYYDPHYFISETFTRTEK